MEQKFRHLCMTCLQPEFGCYCCHIRSFAAPIKFVILIHPIEFRRRIATGRMAHLSIQNSLLISGQNFSNHSQVNELLADSQYQPMVLYPGPKSLNITNITHPQRSELFQSHKIPLLFVIDGTWATAKKMMWQSENLKSLPRICFTPTQKSQFRVRKQPAPECLSTIEAIHHTLDLLQMMPSREHDSLLFVFNKMVERQLDFIRLAELDPSRSHYRRPRTRFAS